jgi:retron-type reverse transcriptase
MAVKMVIEPIFEADFQDNSYGFRPKRSAHQAVQDVTEHLLKGKTDVIDADISKYFDTIPHDKLMQQVTQDATAPRAATVTPAPLEPASPTSDGRTRDSLRSRDREAR